ncbi:MAG: hypothetical protein RSG07_04690, partial [Erysipelotrichaceae bacterium]
MKKSLIVLGLAFSGVILGSFIIPVEPAKTGLTVINSGATDVIGEKFSEAAVGNKQALTKAAGELIAVDGHLEVSSLTATSHPVLVRSSAMVAFKFAPLTTGVKVIYADTSDRIFSDINPSTVETLNLFGTFEAEVTADNWATVEAGIKGKITTANYTAPYGYSWDGTSISYTKCTATEATVVESPVQADFVGSIMVARPVIVKSNTATFEVKATGTTATVNGNATYTAHYDELVTFTSTSPTFNHWKIGTEIVSYNKELKLTAFAALTAEEVLGGTAVKAANVYKHDILALASPEAAVYQVKYELLEGQTFIESGMLFGAKTYEKATSKVIARSISADNEYAVTSATTGENCAYLMFKDVDNAIKVIYSGVESPVVPTPSETTKTINFGTDTSFKNWTSSYTKHDEVVDNVNISFEKANKQSGTITDCPVTKGFSLTVSIKNQDVVNFTVSLKRWGTKVHKVDIQYSTDGLTFVD